MARLPRSPGVQVSLPVVSLQGTGPSAEAAGAVGGAVVAAADMGGRLAQAAAQDAQAANLKRDRLKAAQILADTRVDLTRQLLAAQEGAQPGADGFTADWKTLQDKATARALAAMPESVRAEFAIDMTGLAGQLEGTALTFEARERLDHNKELTAGIADSIANAVALDPGQLDSALDQWALAVDASGLPETAIPGVLKAGEATIAEAAVRSLNDSDPEATRDMLAQGMFNDVLGPDRLEVLRNDNATAIARLEAERRARQAEAAAGARLKIEDDLASMAVTGKGTVADPIALAQQLGGPEGEAYLEARRRANDRYVAVTAIKAMPPEEASAYVATLAPEGEGFADELATQQAVVDSYNGFRTRLESDPAGTVAAELGISGIAASLEEQARLGVAPQDRRVLPAAAAADLAGRFDALPPDQYVQTLDAIRAEIGDAYWPQAVAEMVDAGLPAAAEVVTAMDRPAQAGAREALIAALQTGTGELYKAVGLDEGTTKSGFRAEVAAALEPFIATAAAQDLTGGGGAMANTYIDAVEALALRHMAKGRGQSDAIALAADQVINNQYAFLDTYRVPVEYDAAAVEAAAYDRLSTLEVGDFMAFPVMSDDGLSDQARAENQRDALREQAYWVTDPLEQGLVLVVDLGDGSTVPVRTPSGAPVALAFDAAAAAGADLPRPTGGSGDIPPGMSFGGFGGFGGAAN